MSGYTSDEIRVRLEAMKVRSEVTRSTGVVPPTDPRQLDFERRVRAGTIAPMTWHELRVNAALARDQKARQKKRENKHSARRKNAKAARRKNRGG